MTIPLYINRGSQAYPYSDVIWRHQQKYVAEYKAKIQYTVPIEIYRCDTETGELPFSNSGTYIVNVYTEY